MKQTNDSDTEDTTATTTATSTTTPATTTTTAATTTTTTKARPRLHDVILAAIIKGAPLYNRGNKQGCLDVYLKAAKGHVQLQQAADEAIRSKDVLAGTWILRSRFDEILQTGGANSTTSGATAAGEEDNATTSTPTTRDDEDDGDVGPHDDLLPLVLANMYVRVRSILVPATHTRSRKTYENCFPASQVTNALLTLGIATLKTVAAQQTNLLFREGLIISVMDETLVSSNGLFRFPTPEEMMLKPKQDSVLFKTLLEPPQQEIVNKDFVSRDSVEYHQGSELTKWAAIVKSIVHVRNCKHHLTTYKDCFMGTEAITAVVNNSDLLPATNRGNAKSLLNKLLHVGLLYHVTRDHEIEETKRCFIDSLLPMSCSACGRPTAFWLVPPFNMNWCGMLCSRNSKNSALSRHGQICSSTHQEQLANHRKAVFTCRRNIKPGAFSLPCGLLRWLRLWMWQIANTTW
jgi:hypothetical protein